MSNMSKVTFNFKNDDGAARSFPLSRLNFIIGPNGSGKSAIVQAVGLAVSGAVDDLAGRAVTTDTGLIMGMLHGRGLDGTPLFSELELGGDERCRWGTYRDGTTIKTPTHIRPRWVIPQTSKQSSPHFPYREVADILVGTPKQARERFLSWVCADLTEADVREHMVECLETYDKLAKIAGDLAPVDLLGSITVMADKTMRDLNADGRANDKLVESLKAQGLSVVRDAQVLAAKDKVRELDALYEEAVRADAVAQQQQATEGLAAQLAQVTADLQAAKATLADFSTFRAGLDLPKGAEAEGSAGALQALSWAISEGFDACPICSSDVGAAHIKACSDFYTDKLKDSARVRAEAASADSRIAQARMAVDQLERKADALRNQSQAAATPAKAGAVSLDEVKANLAQARQEFSDLQAAQGRQQQLTDAVARRDAAFADAVKYQKIKGVAQDAIKTILVSRTDAFCARVSTFLPEGWRFGVIVDDGGRDVFYYGLFEGEGESEYLKVGLSEGQRAAVLVALCLTLDAAMPQPLTTVVLADRGWDADTLGDVVSSVGDTPAHIFVTSTVMPSKASLEGWNIIDLRPPGGQVEPEPEVEPEVAAPVRSAHRPLPPPPRPRARVLDTTELLVGTGARVVEDDEDAEDEDEDDAPAWSTARTSAPTAYVLPDALAAQLEPMGGRARGGKFRSLKLAAFNFAADVGLTNGLKTFMATHPEAGVTLDMDATTFSAQAANYLCPLGPA